MCGGGKRGKGSLMFVEIVHLLSIDGNYGMG